MSVAEVVYGRDHVKKHHISKVYKARYLKTLDPVSRKMYALPDGLPGYSLADSDFKVHLVGHSMGGMTARHF